MTTGSKLAYIYWIPVGGVDLWKYVDHTTIAETVYNNDISNIQVEV